MKQGPFSRRSLLRGTLGGGRSAADSLQRRFSDEEIRKIPGGNALDFPERVLDKKPWGVYAPG